jgi:hypothetical protein
MNSAVENQLAEYINAFVDRTTCSAHPRSQVTPVYVKFA